jgi:hypothetical protein
MMHVFCILPKYLTAAITASHIHTYTHTGSPPWSLAGSARSSTELSFDQLADAAQLSLRPGSHVYQICRGKMVAGRVEA